MKSFVLDVGADFTFRAGQHVDVRLTAEDGYQAQRSYSIASAPELRGTIELMIEKLEDGEVSPFFHDGAQVGDAIELRGPIGGHFVWEATSGGPVLLAGGGSGIAPLMAIARHRFAAGSTAPMGMVFSARSWDEAMYRDELVEMEARGDGFLVVFALTRDAREAGALRAGDYARRVDEAMMRDVVSRLGSVAQAFVCGSNPFVEAAVRGMIAAGVDTRVVKTERYGG